MHQSKLSSSWPPFESTVWSVCLRPTARDSLQDCPLATVRGVRVLRSRVVLGDKLTTGLRNRRTGISEKNGEEGQSERGSICTDAALGRRYYTLDPMREAERAKNLARAPRGRFVSPLPIVLQRHRTSPLLQVITLTSAVTL